METEEIPTFVGMTDEIHTVTDFRPNDGRTSLESREGATSEGLESVGRNDQGRPRHNEERALHQLDERSARTRITDAQLRA